jgi:hypothetical protein
VDGDHVESLTGPGGRLRTHKSLNVSGVVDSVENGAKRRCVGIERAILFFSICLLKQGIDGVAGII